MSESSEMRGHSFAGDSVGWTAIFAQHVVQRSTERMRNRCISGVLKPPTRVRWLAVYASASAPPLVGQAAAHRNAPARQGVPSLDSIALAVPDRKGRLRRRGPALERPWHSVHLPANSSCCRGRNEFEQLTAEQLRLRISAASMVDLRPSRAAISSTYPSDQRRPRSNNVDVLQMKACRLHIPKASVGQR